MSKRVVWLVVGRTSGGWFNTKRNALADARFCGRIWGRSFRIVRATIDDGAVKAAKRGKA